MHLLGYSLYFPRYLDANFFKSLNIFPDDSHSSSFWIKSEPFNLFWSATDPRNKIPSRSRISLRRPRRHSLPKTTAKRTMRARTLPGARRAYRLRREGSWVDRAESRDWKAFLGPWRRRLPPSLAARTGELGVLEASENTDFIWKLCNNTQISLISLLYSVTVAHIRNMEHHLLYSITLDWTLFTIESLIPIKY